uniref:Reverse transcriptase domain-containing protein n=1 Tax=Trichobilharzia regenti TaxID=157069 RepID=A0AA85J6C2_TRIRE|nr:unnamed protein product [Trichobilharzia regenti]
MGSPLGQIMADFSLEKLQKAPLRDVAYNLDFYCRYVDDIFTVVKKESETRDILEKFNKAHPGISFTKEEEENDSISFRDVLMTERTHRTYFNWTIYLLSELRTDTI